MSGPRVIYRHAFMSKPATITGSPYPPANPSTCNQCGLPYEAPVHWILAEELEKGPLEKMAENDEKRAPSWAPRLHDSFTESILAQGEEMVRNAQTQREREAYGVTIESVLDQLPQPDAKRVANLARDAVYFRMSVPSIIANVIEATPGLSLGLLNIQPEKWDEAYKRWYELAKRN